eukprot:COSAG04_NODE_280_length_18201_cov_5.871119_1_plen_193_part_00
MVPHPQEAENRKKQVLDAAAEKQERLEVAFHAAEEASRERRAAAAAQALIERQDAKRESLRKVERQREDNARAEEVRKAQAAVNLAFAEEQATLAEQRRELAVRSCPPESTERNRPHPYASRVVSGLRQAAEAEVEAKVVELRRQVTKARAAEVQKRHVEQAKVRMLRQGLTPPPAGAGSERVLPPSASDRV